MLVLSLAPRIHLAATTTLAREPLVPMYSRFSTEDLAEFAKGDLEGASQRRLNLIDRSGGGTAEADVGCVSMGLKMGLVQLSSVSYNARK